MGQEVVTLECASRVRERLGMPWKWGLLGVAVVNVGTAFELMREVMGWRDGLKSFELWSPQLNFMMAPVLAYLIFRLSLGRLRPIEQLMGYGIASLCAVPSLLWTAIICAMLLFGIAGRLPLIFSGIAIYVGVWTLSLGMVLFGGVLAWRARRSHEVGVELVVLLMTCYVSNGCWVMLVGLNDLRIGAWMFAGVSVWFVVEMGVMWVRDRAWRRGVREHG